MPNTTCSIADCAKLVYIMRAGLCAMHYKRLRKYGDTDHPVKVYRTSAPMPPAELFASLVKYSPNGCHVWQGRILTDGYGGFQTLRAHRWAWEQAHGAIPAGMIVRHKCDNPPCVRVEHLELGSYQDNMDDKVDRGRSLRGSRNPIAKLDEAKVLEIKKALKAGSAMHRDLAAKYGVAAVTISHIARGRSWKHVTIEAA